MNARGLTCVANSNVAPSLQVALPEGMEDVSARADHPSTVVAGDSRIVAAIDSRESSWFLKQAGMGGERIEGVAVSNLAACGWNHAVEEIYERNPEVLLTCWSTPYLSESWLQSKACRLRYICHLTGSVRHVVSRRFIECGGLVSNWGSLPAPAVAEHAVLLALAALRNLPGWSRVFNEPGLAPVRMETLKVRTLSGRRVGIHGFGQVARALVRLLAAFEASVCAYSVGVPDDLFAAAGVRRVTSLNELFATNDVVFECEALNPLTHGVVKAADLAAMPDDAVLVNVARAGLIDEEALFQEAVKGRIRVALDVFAEEPLHPSSRWLQTPGLVLSPHIAGPTFDQYRACAEIAVANVGRYLRGELPEFVVTTEIYDRST
jgi:phosphoglycerate dehydrogenase-like enzyme